LLDIVNGQLINTDIYSIDIRVCEFTRVTPRINFNRSLVCPKNINWNHHL